MPEVNSDETTGTRPMPPQALREPKELESHGDLRVDPYYWMRERDTERVLDHLRAESDFYASVTRPSLELRDKVYEEIKARVKADDSAPPVKNGPYFYTTRFKAGFEYPITSRAKLETASESEQEVILDINKIARGQTYTSVSNVLPSPDHKWIVYGVDHVGRRFYDLYFKNLETGEISGSVVPKTTGNVEWADNRTIFYTLQNPETLRSERVMRFDFVSGETTEVFFEPDEIFRVHVSKTQNDDFILINTASFDSSEVHFVPAQNPKAKLSVFLPRELKHEYSIDFGEGSFYILTNWNAENFCVMKTSGGATGGAFGDAGFAKADWLPVIAHRSDVYISQLLLLKKQLVLGVRTEGLTRIEVIDRVNLKSEVISFPDAAHIVKLSSNFEYDTDFVRLNYQSMVRPNSVYNYFFETKELRRIKLSEIPTYDESKYQSERIWATAKDGTRIPVSLIYRKDLKTSGKNPILVYGYGSYGFSVDPSFRISIVSLLDRGFVYAIAHVRGGSELGRSWYEQGRMNHKMNTFTDFIAVTEHLIDQGYADPKKVFASGGSAGGLLMGVISNLRPDLYKGIVSSVPFLDVLTTMLDADIPLTTAEYQQWGNPGNKEAYAYIKSYSPYDNIEAKAYPAMLIVTGYHDSQVQYWEPAKYVAKLRDLSTSKNPILFKIDMEAGHSGASGRFQALKDVAHEWAFLINLASEPT